MTHGPPFLAPKNQIFTNFRTHVRTSTKKPFLNPLCLRGQESRIDPDLDTFEKCRDTPPISIAILLQKYALLLAESSIYTTNLYHDTPPICLAMLLQKYEGQTPKVIDLLMSLFRGAVFQPISVNGPFPDLNGPFSELNGPFPKCLSGPFSLLKIPGKPGDSQTVICKPCSENSWTKG